MDLCSRKELDDGQHKMILRFAVHKSQFRRLVVKRLPALQAVCGLLNVLVILLIYFSYPSKSDVAEKLIAIQTQYKIYPNTNSGDIYHGEDWNGESLAHGLSTDFGSHEFKNHFGTFVENARRNDFAFPGDEVVYTVDSTRAVNFEVTFTSTKESVGDWAINPMKKVGSSSSSICNYFATNPMTGQRLALTGSGACPNYPESKLTFILSKESSVIGQPLFTNIRKDNGEQARFTLYVSNPDDFESNYVKYKDAVGVMMAASYPSGWYYIWLFMASVSFMCINGLRENTMRKYP